MAMTHSASIFPWLFWINTAFKSMHACSLHLIMYTCYHVRKLREISSQGLLFVFKYADCGVCIFVGYQ